MRYSSFHMSTTTIPTHNLTHIYMNHNENSNNGDGSMTGTKKSDKYSMSALVYSVVKIDKLKLINWKQDNMRAYSCFIFSQPPRAWIHINISLSLAAQHRIQQTNKTVRDPFCAGWKSAARYAQIYDLLIYTLACVLCAETMRVHAPTAASTCFTSEYKSKISTSTGVSYALFLNYFYF